MTHPVTMGVFADGGLTVDQAAVAVQAPPHNDAEVAALAPLRHRHPDPRRSSRWPTRRSEPAAPDTPDETVATWFDRDGRFFVSAELDADHGRIVDAALSAARDRLFRDGDPAVTWVDALIDICERSLDTETPERRDRFRINMFFDLTDPVPARWADRSPVPDSIRQHLTCDGTFTPTFLDHGPTGGRRNLRARHPGTHPTSRHVPGSAMPGAVVHPDPLARRPPHHPPRTRRPDRDGEPGRAVPTLPPGPPPRPVRHPRQRRHPRRAHVQRPRRPPPHRAPHTSPHPTARHPDPHHPYQHPPGERLHRRWLFLSDPPKDPPTSAA